MSYSACQMGASLSYWFQWMARVGAWFREVAGLGAALDACTCAVVLDALVGKRCAGPNEERLLAGNASVRCALSDVQVEQEAFGRLGKRPGRGRRPDPTVRPLSSALG
jgi:hypothetical protein